MISLTGIESGADKPSSAVTYWMPFAVFTSAVVFVIAFVMRLPPDRTIVATALAAGTVFSGFFIRSLGKEKDNYRKTDSE
ncbi:hypothetical protein BH18THE2_BH18THE2_31550 [soil metagenome]